MLFVFGRPFLRSLNPNRNESDKKNLDSENSEAFDGQGNPQQRAQYNYAGQAHMPLPDDPNSAAAMIRLSDATHEQKVEMARTLVQDDPARVANVMKHWVGSEQ